MFHLVPNTINDLTIERVKIRAPDNAPNTDAIDPGIVTNAVIRDCDIDTGDDDIAIKSGATNLLIENCVIKHGHGSATLTTVEGEPLTASLEGSSVILTDAKGGKSTVTTADVFQSNGVVHVIDTVLMP